MPGKFTYYTIYDFMSADSQLHGAVKEVFAIVYGICMMKKGPGEVPLRFTQRLSGLTRQTIITSLEALIKKGFIERVGKGAYGATIYMVKKYYPPPISNMDETSNEEVRSNLLTGKKTEPVKKLDRSKEWTGDRSTLLTNCGQIIRPNSTNYKQITERNPQLFIKEEFVGKSTI